MAISAKDELLTLLDAATLAADRSRIELAEAQKTLLALLRRGAIAARGAVPLNARSNNELAWRHAHAIKDEDIPPSAWGLSVDWSRGWVGRYREVAISEAALAALFRVARGPAKRPAATQVRGVVERYVNQEREAARPVSKSGCWRYVKDNLPGATREQSYAALAKFEPDKPRGRPRKG